ncbi:hypothetical protein ABFS83_12G077100 [Erythranthe nasuta]
MSPSNYQDSDQMMKGVTTMINGSRPSPLRINKDSHAIHKIPSSSSLYLNPDQNPSAAAAAKHHGGGGVSSSKRQQPVIIYTHSPKVIHAQARDFMALVQKLTGKSRAEGGERIAAAVKPEPEESGLAVSSDGKDGGAVENVNIVGYDETESCSMLTDCPPLYKFTNSYFDAPIFTPSSNDILCSTRPANQISPSLIEMMNNFP